MKLLIRLCRWSRIPCPISAASIDWFSENERERFLLPDELRRYIASVQREPDEGMRDYLLLSLFIGARKSSLCAMEWSEIDFTTSTWTIPAGKSKSRKAVMLPLAPEALEILNRRLKEQTESSPWVFPARNSQSRLGHITQPGNAHNRACKLAGVSDLHLHDLRRSCAAYQVASGASLIHVAGALGHTNTKATAVYARLQSEGVRDAVTNGVAAMLAAAKPID